MRYVKTVEVSFRFVLKEFGDSTRSRRESTGVLDSRGRRGLHFGLYDHLCLGPTYPVSANSQEGMVQSIWRVYCAACFHRFTPTKLMTSMLCRS